MSAEVKVGSVWRQRGSDEADPWLLIIKEVPWGDRGDMALLVWQDGSEGAWEINRFPREFDHIADDIDPRIITTPAHPSGLPTDCLACGAEKAIGYAYLCPICFDRETANDAYGYWRLRDQWNTIRRQPAKVEAKQEWSPGDPPLPRPPIVVPRPDLPAKSPQCKFPDCEATAPKYGRALCDRHYAVVEASNVGKSPVGWRESGIEAKRFEPPPSQPACNASWRLK